MKRKLFVLLIGVIMIVSMSLVGCTSSTDTGEVDSLSDGVLTVAVDDTYPPMEYNDENGELVGFDIDLANALGEELGVEVEFISTAWDSIFAGLENEKYDCIISSVSMTTERMETMDYSMPYLANGQVIVVTPGDDSIQSIDDLADKTVGVQFGTTADEAAEKYVDEVGFTLQSFDDMTTCLAAMEAGNIDCMVADYAVALDAVANNPDAFEISSTQLTNEPIAIAVNKDNTSLVEALDEALVTLQENGTLSEISIEHLGDDYTQDIDTELTE
jgi:polar amino acid transport system substrate-binding protein